MPAQSNKEELFGCNVFLRRKVSEQVLSHTVATKCEGEQLNLVPDAPRRRDLKLRSQIKTVAGLIYFALYLAGSS